jgi:hypothetical protein
MKVPTLAARPRAIAAVQGTPEVSRNLCSRISLPYTFQLNWL